MGLSKIYTSNVDLHGAAPSYTTNAVQHPALVHAVSLMDLPLALDVMPEDPWWPKEVEPDKL